MKESIDVITGSGILYSPSSHEAVTPTSVINGNNEASTGNRYFSVKKQFYV